jgi:phage gp45-like
MSMSGSDWARVKREIQLQIQLIWSGQTAATQIDDIVGTESIDNSPPGMPTIEARPVAHPYGMQSRAPKGTFQVVAQQGAAPTNRIVLLHRDKDRPKLNAEGEVMLYDKFGNQIWMQDGKIVVKLDDKLEIGEGATKQAARKADTVKVTMTALNIASLAGLISSSPSGGPCFPTPPGVATLDLTTGEITSGSSKVTIVD